MNGSVRNVLDALIVGAGFSGVYQLKCLRDEGWNVKLVDNASDYGGAWYWNCYPGARVDSHVPTYQFSDPLLWKEWKWKQRFPGSQELRQYFTFVTEKWNLRKDTEFNFCIEKAVWNEQEANWTISGPNGKTFHARYLLLNTGISAKRFTPAWDGVTDFQGQWIDPSYWSKSEINLEKKKVAIIGTGATAIQIAQEVSQCAAELVIFQRTPALALPMKQIDYKDGERSCLERQASDFFGKREHTFAGFSYTFADRKTFDENTETRHAFYEKLWAAGDFQFWLANYQDMIIDDKANTEAYEFWKKKIRSRIHDPTLQHVLAPDVKPYAFGCKRVPLENGYYDIFNQDNVSLVDINRTPILKITKAGIQTTEKEWDFDCVVCATGYDAITGGLMQMDIRGVAGNSLAEKWTAGVKTYLGMAVAGFPNLFFGYGPQAPTALCNAPTCAEYHGDFIVQTLNHMRQNKHNRIEAEIDAENRWGELISALANNTLFPGTKSVSFPRAARMLAFH